MRRDVQRWWRNIGGNVGWSGASPNIHLELIRSCHRTVAQVIPDATLSGHPFLLERVKTTLNCTYGLIIGSCIVCSSPSKLLRRISAAEILINEIEQTLSQYYIGQGPQGFLQQYWGHCGFLWVPQTWESYFLNPSQMAVQIVSQCSGQLLLRFHPQHVRFHFYFFILPISLEQHAMNACSSIFTFFHA